MTLDPSEHRQHLQEVAVLAGLHFDEVVVHGDQPKALVRELDRFLGAAVPTA